MNPTEILTGVFAWAHPTDQINYLVNGMPGSIGETANHKPSVGFYVGAALPVVALYLLFSGRKR